MEILIGFKFMKIYMLFRLNTLAQLWMVTHLALYRHVNEDRYSAIYLDSVRIKWLIDCCSMLNEP